jgi:hypothetical protein
MGIKETTNSDNLISRSRICSRYIRSMSSSLDEKNVEELRPRAGKSDNDFL